MYYVMYKSRDIRTKCEKKPIKRHIKTAKIICVILLFSNDDAMVQAELMLERCVCRDCRRNCLLELGKH